jgi:hypothetical protein
MTEILTKNSNKMPQHFEQLGNVKDFLCKAAGRKVDCATELQEYRRNKTCRSLRKDV